jgi:hypothetical protein
MKQRNRGQYHIWRVAHVGGIHQPDVLEAYALYVLAPTNIVATKIIIMKVLSRRHAGYHLCGMVLMIPQQQPGNHGLFLLIFWSKLVSTV